MFRHQHRQFLEKKLNLGRGKRRKIKKDVSKRSERKRRNREEREREGWDEGGFEGAKSCDYFSRISVFEVRQGLVESFGVDVVVVTVVVGVGGGGCGGCALGRKTFGERMGLGLLFQILRMNPSHH